MFSRANFNKTLSLRFRHVTRSPVTSPDTHGFTDADGTRLRSTGVGCLHVPGYVNVKCGRGVQRNNGCNAGDTIRARAATALWDSISHGKRRCRTWRRYWAHYWIAISTGSLVSLWSFRVLKDACHPTDSILTKDLTDFITDLPRRRDGRGAAARRRKSLTRGRGSATSI